ncbi:MAG: sodium:solute symporter family protein [Eubacteriaceae bacterium]
MSITLGIIIFYMLLMLAVSFISTRMMKKQDTENFLLAGKNLNWILIGVVIAGLGIGGVSTVGVAENAYTSGMAAGQYLVAWAIGAILFGVAATRRLRMSKAVTVIEALDLGFGKATGFIVMLAQMFVGFAIFAMQMVAGGAILSSLLPDIFTLSTGMLASAVIFGAVAIIGGLWSAALSNVVNIIVIVLGLIIGVIVVIKHFGGMDVITAALPVGKSGDGSHWFNPISGYGWPKVLGQICSMTVLAFAIQTCMQTAIASKDSKNARKGFILAALIMLPMGFVAALLGIVAASQVPGLASAKLALPAVITQINPWIAGFTLAGLWAADVSTATGIAVGQSTMFTKDIMVKYFKPNMSEKAQIWTSRIMMLVIIVLGYFFAINMKGIIDTLMKLLTLWTPIAVLMFFTFAVPKICKKSTGIVVMLVGGVFGVCSLFFPQIVIAGQAVFGTCLVSIAMVILTAIFDKRPANFKALYGKELDELEKEEKAAV